MGNDTDRNIKLTVKQKEAIQRANRNTEYTFRCHWKTADSLVELGVAKWTSGFGYKWGGILELTELGLTIKNNLP